MRPSDSFLILSPAVHCVALELCFQPKLTVFFWNLGCPVYCTIVMCCSTTGKLNRINPYQSYTISEELIFPVENESKVDLHPKKTVLGVQLGNGHKVYPFSRLAEYGESQFEDTLDGNLLTIVWESESKSAHALDAQ